MSYIELSLIDDIQSHRHSEQLSRCYLQLVYFNRMIYLPCPLLLINIDPELNISLSKLHVYVRNNFLAVSFTLIRLDS